MNSISLILEQSIDGDDFYLLLGDFLDEFYKATKDTKQEMIDVIPTEKGLNNDQEINSFAASTAHKLANDFKLAVPKWVFENQYYIKDKPFFACNAKGNLRLLFMYKSPAEFKHRNMFVDENVLSRV